MHDRFYEDLRELLGRVQRAWGRFVVIDLHTYNHRRSRPGEPPEDPAANPDINMGTGSVDRRRWGHLVDRFIGDLAAQEVRGARLDVRENVRFRGAHLVTWVNETFAGAACALAIEVKKFFMDEHTGHLAEVAHKEIHRALVQAVVTDEMLRIAEIVRPKLMRDGLFFVGLDIAGDKLMEITCSAPGASEASGNTPRWTSPRSSSRRSNRRSATARPTGGSPIRSSPRSDRDETHPPAHPACGPPPRAGGTPAGPWPPVTGRL
ncbi:MAG: N-formylglutamate amidohydrolase [Actinomycetota bacterium]